MPDPQQDIRQGVGDLFSAEPAVAVLNTTASIGKKAQEWLGLATKAAQDAGLDPEFVTRLIGAESNWNPSAVSKKGAQGLMQVLPTTAKQYGVSNLMNPSENIKAGISYLKDLTKKYGQDRPDLVAAAYNAGPGAVDKSGGVPNYPETQAYVQKVAGPDLEKAWKPVTESANAWKPVAESAPEPSQSAASVVGDIAMGALKQPGRLVQMIPGVTAATDKLYGLPSGSSAKAMEPKNAAEQVGGYAADLAELVGPGLAEVGGKLALSAADVTRVKALINSGMSQADALKAVVKIPTYAGKTIASLGDFGLNAYAGARNELLGTKAVTSKRIAELIGKYGAKAVKYALAGAGFKMGLDMWEDLTK